MLLWIIRITEHRKIEQLGTLDCKNMEGYYYCLRFGDTSASV